MSAPVRRPRRPEITRPATADPYASRRMLKPETPSRSPAESPKRDVSTKSTKLTAPKSAARTRPIQERTPAPARLSPAASPIRHKARAGPAHDESQSLLDDFVSDSSTLSPSKHENFTMVVPAGQSLLAHSEVPFRRSPLGPPNGGLSSFAEDDGFTMIMPDIKNTNRAERVPSPLRSPFKAGPEQPHLLSGLAKDTRPTSSDSNHSSRVMLSGGLDEIKDTEDMQARENKVKVYEDPFVEDEVTTAKQAQEPRKPVLEELPANEQSLDRVRSNTGTDASLSNNDFVRSSRERQWSPSKLSNNETISGMTNGTSPTRTDQTEILRSRRLLASGIDRIRARTLDTHGFRRLQDLIKNTPEIWDGSSKFSELLLALLDSLETPWPSEENGKTASAKTQNLKGQTLVTTRALLVLYRKEALPYYPKALCAVVHAKAHAESTSHISAELEKTADEIMRHGNVTDCIDSVLDLLSTTDSTHPSPISTPSSTASHPSPSPSTPKNSTVPHIAAAALSALTSLLRHASTRDAAALDPARTQRLGRAATRSLGDVSPDVRKAALDFCVEMHERVGHEPAVFWKALAGAEDRHLNLITYYIARKAAVAQGRA